MRSLYWKICGTFILVILISMVAGVRTFHSVWGHLRRARFESMVERWERQEGDPLPPPPPGGPGHDGPPPPGVRLPGGPPPPDGPPPHDASDEDDARNRRTASRSWYDRVRGVLGLPPSRRGRSRRSRHRWISPRTLRYLVDHMCVTTARLVDERLKDGESLDKVIEGLFPDERRGGKSRVDIRVGARSLTGEVFGDVPDEVWAEVGGGGVEVGADAALQRERPDAAPVTRGPPDLIDRGDEGVFRVLPLESAEGWLVIGTVPQSRFTPPDDDELRLDVLQAGGSALAVILFVAVFLGLVVFRHLMKRLRLFGSSLTRVADGDLGCRMEDPGTDEIGDLGVAFNRMAARLQEVVGKLESVDERRRQFLADVSHELRTPLTSVRANLDNMLADLHDGTGRGVTPDEDPGGRAAPTPVDPGDDRKEILSLSLEEVDHMSHLVEDLLEMARMDSPRFELDRAEVVLQRVVKRVVDRLRLSAENRTIRLSTHFSEDPIRREVDERRISQVVTNLLVNAIRSTDEAGIVEVHVFERPDEEWPVMIEIHDDGPGIPEEMRQEVFDRFESMTRGGTGLGLSIVRKLTEAHGGRVELVPRDEGGTIARIRLP